MTRNYAQAPNPLNPEGMTKLSTSCEIYALVPNEDGTSTTSVKCGTARSASIEESREIIYNKVIGNKNPARPRDIIAGTVQRSAIRFNSITFYNMSLVGLFSDGTNSQVTTGKKVALGVVGQTRPFDAVFRWTTSTGKVVYDAVYKGIMIEDATTNIDIDGDIRVMEDVTAHYKDSEVVIGPGMADTTLGDPLAA